MSRTIDERVVEMRFDNKQFESGVQTSLSTLEKLKKGLDLDGAAKGFDQLSTAAKRCDMSAIGRSVETVQAKFSAFEVVAMTALSNITNSAVNAGKRLLSSLTIEPVSTGFNEYELKMGSIQTIMASTGESLDKVNQKLDELNRYSDRTIYSFSDMTTNIGKFTNAGVKLDDAVAAIQGVSNVAAVSGANANEASRAMYNFAQALSAGYVKLIDWKSIENANMATVEFKTQLLESAVAAGTLTKTADGMYKTLAKGTVIDATHLFNDSLQEQWMTTEVLTETLKDYADETTEIGKKAFAAAQDVKTWTQLLDTLKESAQSGWAETWQLVAGDYEEAKATLRTFSEFFSSIIDGSAEARNALLEGALMSSWGQIKNRVNETGISVDSFRDTLRETAESSVEGLDKIIEEAGSFDAALSKGWLTTDILSDTLDNLVSKAAGTQVSISELSDEQLQNIGYTQEQIEALRALSEEAKSSDSNLASLVSTLDRQSGRELLFDSLLNGAKAVQGLFQTIKGAWQDIFPPATSEQLYSFIEALHSASERIRDFFTQAEEGADGFTGAINKPLQDIGNTFKGLFAILDIVKQAFSALWRVITPAGSAVGGLLTGVLGLTGSFGEWLAKLDESIKKGDVFYKVLKSIVDVVKGAITVVTGFAAAIGESLGFPGLDGATASVEAFLGTLKEKVSAPGLEKLQAIFDGICTRAKWVKDAIVGMKDGVVDSMGKIDGAVSGNKFVQVLTGIGTLIREVASAIAGLLGKAIDGLINTLSNADFNGILDFLNALAAGGIIAAIRKFIDPVEELENTFTSLKDWVKGLGGGVTKILDGVRGSLEAWQTKLKSDALGKIAASIAVLSVSLLVLSSIDSDKVTGSLAAMGTMFAELIASMAVLDKLSIDGKSANKTASAMIKMGAALLVLSLAMKNIAELNPEQLAEGLIGVGVLLAEVDLFLNTAKFDKKASKSATGMILFAAAIKILSSAVKSLGEMDWDDMAKGLVGVGVLLAEVEVFLNNAKFNGKAVLTATGIVILSSAIKVLASACKDFGSMSWGEITKGLTSIAALLLEITAFTKLTGDAKHVISTGLALIEIAAAMKIFASAMSDFGSMSGSEIAKGLVAMGGALAEVAIAVNLMPKNMVSVGSGLVIVGAALKIVASALSSMGNMSWESIAKGLVAMGGALAELAIGLNVMNGTLAGSAALLVAAGALTVLTPVLVILGNMSWESIAKGLITIAGAFTVMGVAGAVLGPLAPSILAISGALALLGVGSVAIGAGLTLIGTGLTSIAVGLTSLAAAFASSGTLIVGGLSAIVLGFAGLIPAIAEKIGEAIVAFCGAISSGAPAIGEAVKAIVLTLVDVLVQCVPAIADGALQLVTGVLASLVAYTPQIVDSVMQFLIEVLEGIARNIPQLVQAAMDVVGAFFAGVLSALSNIDSSSLIQGIAAVGLLTALVAALGAVSGLIPAAMAGVLGMGVVITELSVVLAAIGALAQIPGLEWLISEGGQFLQTVGNAIGRFVGGIVGGFMSGVSSSFPQIGADLSSFMTNVKPFIDGAGSISPDMLTGVKALTEAIILITAADLLEGLTSWLTGGSSLSDFAEQLVPFGEAMMKFSNTISGLDGDLVSTAAIAGKTLAEMAATLPNSGGVVGFFAGENDMEEFGNQLSGFGKSMMDFADSIKGLDSDAVQNAAIAGKAMAEMAATLPNTGGAVSFFTGNNDMDTFGDQLVPFGKAIKEYSDAVAGLDADAVVNSAIAGKSLVELANTIPNTGGAVAFFTGDNDLATFGEQIVVFGKAMKEYSQTVSGLDAEAVTNSATAGAILVELANTVPNTGGLVAWFKGDNKLSTFGEELISFGNNLSAYSTAISGMKPDAVVASANAAQALSNLATGLPDSSLFDQWFGGDQTLATFGNDIAKFGDSMSDYYAAISAIDLSKMDGVVTAVWSLVDLAKGVKDIDKNAFSNFSSSLSSLASTGITGFTTAFYNCDSEVTSAVVSMLNTVGSSITENASIPNSSMQVVVASLVEVIKTKTTDVGIATTSMMSVMSTKITSYTVRIKTAMGVVVSAAVSKINELKPQFELAGKNAGQGFVNGINAKMSASSTAGRNLGLAALNASKKALDSHSPSREYIHLGENIGAGLAIGVKNSIVPASQAASGMIDEVIAVSSKGIDAFEKWAEEKKYYGELSLKDELAGYENLQQKYKAGSEERIKIDREVYRIQNELVSATYQASMDWIEEEKYYNRLSLEEELAAYERVQARYLEGSEERKKADREVYRLRNELVDASYQNSMDWIEKEKYYNRMSLSDELAAYKRVQSRYAKGTEEREKMDREVYRVEKEIYEAQKQYIADVQSAQASANQKRLDLEQEYADKVKSINDKLASDIQSLNDQYQSAVESRTKSLYQSYGLFDAVKEREEVSGETLMKNLEGQVQEFGQWQDILDSLSARGLDSELIGELQEMGPSAIAELKALNSMSDSELEKYAALWSIKHAQAREQAVGELEGLRIETQNSIAQLRVDAERELDDYRATWQTKMNQVTIDANRELEELRQAFGEKVGLIKKDTEKETQEMVDTAQAILKEAGWDETGKQIVTGIKAGVEEEKPNFLDALTQMALEGVQAVKDTLDINSPSRVFQELGNYTGLGFVKGLTDYANKSYDAAANVAGYATDGLSNAISKVSDLVNGEFDMQPTIRPVLDFTDVARGAGELNSLLGYTRTLALAGQTSLAFNSTLDKDGMTVTVDNDGVVQELRSLRSEMAEMTARMERMQVVLDTGTLVGQMADPLDAALGQKQTFRGRGI